MKPEHTIPLSAVLLTPFKAAGGCDTAQAGSSFGVSFMMQPLMRDWPMSPGPLPTSHGGSLRLVQFYNAWAVNTAVSCI